MKTTEMLEIERALHAIELMLEGRYGDPEATPRSSPADLGESPATNEAAPRRIDEASNPGRERSAIHLCLRSSAMLLNVTQRLMLEPAYRSQTERTQHLRLLVDEIRAAARPAYRAALILVGEDPSLPSPADTKRQ